MYFCEAPPRQTGRAPSAITRRVDFAVYHTSHILTAACAPSPDGTATAATTGQQLDEVLTRWGVNPQAWLMQLEQSDYRCTRALGAAHRMVQRAAEVAQRWLQGIRLCREIFADADAETDANPPDASCDGFT